MYRIPEQTATRLLLNQPRHSLLFDITQLHFDRNIVFDTVQHFCIYTRTTMRELASSDVRDGVTLCVRRSGHMRYVVLYNENMRDTRRRRFTLAHELGHIFLGHIDDGDLREQEADAFAAALLLPRILVDQLDQMWQKKLTSEELAAFFGVSRSAAGMRLRSIRICGGRDGYSDCDYALLQVFSGLLPKPDEPWVTI